MTTKKQSFHGPGDIRLIITMDGPRVGEARLSVSDLAEVIRRSQQALRRVAQVLYGQSSIGKGRKKRDIEDLCELYFVAWEKGSAQGVVQLAVPFWKTVPLEDLIQEQQVEAAEDLETLSALWPGGEDPEAFLHFVLDERHERGQLGVRDER